MDDYIIDPKDYPKVISYLKKEKEIPLSFRLKLAQKAFKKTSNYDKKISEFLEKKLNQKLL